MSGTRMLAFVTRTLDAQEQAIRFMGFPSNISLDVEFIDAFLISAEMVAILSRIACRHILYWRLCAMGCAQLRAEGRVLRRTIIVLQHLQSTRDVTADREFAGIRHNSDLF